MSKIRIILLPEQKKQLKIIADVGCMPVKCKQCIIEVFCKEGLSAHKTARALLKASK